MPQKDIAEKTLESYNDVFADIVNVLLFDGRDVVKEDELTEAAEVTMYKADDKLHQQERDVAKYWKNGKIRIALFGFENQTKIDKDMPLRILNYDAAAYRNQLNQNTNFRYPVITLILYFGDSEWKTPHTLYDCIDIPKELKPFVSDYRINIFQVCHFTEEQITKFKSDFKIIADYFVHRNKIPDYKGTPDEIKHVDEFFKLMAVLTNDNEFETVYTVSKSTGGKRKMDEFLVRLKAAGREEGRNEGKLENEIAIVKNMASLGVVIEDIARYTKLSLQEVEAILSDKVVVKN